jgi:hypothetical protein
MKILMCVLALGLGFFTARALDAYTVPQLAGERVELPDDGDKWDLIVFTSDAWQQDARESAFVKGFDTDPGLKKIKSRTRYHHYTTSHPIYQSQFRSVVKDSYPCCILQRPNGYKVYKASANNVPRSPDALCSAMKTKVREHQRTVRGVRHTTKVTTQRSTTPCKVDGTCKEDAAGKGILRRILHHPKPDDKPVDVPKVDTPPVDNTPVDDTPDTEETAGVHWGPLVLFGLLGVAGACVVMFTKAVHG